MHWTEHARYALECLRRNYYLEFAMINAHRRKRKGLVLCITSVLAIFFCFKMVHVYVSPLDPADAEADGGKRTLRDLEDDFSVEELLNDLVVVTGISSNHYNEAQDMLGSVHYFLPDTTIIVYDVGLESEQVQALKELKNVQVRKYEFEANGRTDYRKLRHGAGLGCYAWKIFAMDEISKEHKIFMWFDASIRLVKPLTTNGCIQSLNDIPLSACFNHMYSRRMMQFTDEGTVKYFNITRQQMKDVVGFQAGCLMFKMTKKMQFIMEKWVDCAYNEECICGTKNTRIKIHCNFSVPQGTKFFPGCHRYDQAALTWLSAMHLGMDKVDKVANSNCKKIFVKDRRPTFDWRYHIIKNI